MSDARDVEKRWHDPVALRKAVAYGVGVIVVAGVAFAVFARRRQGLGTAGLEPCPRFCSSAASARS